MTRAAPGILRAGSALLGLVWLAGAASIVIRPEAEHDFVAMTLATGGLLPKAAVTLWTVGIAALGTAMLAGAVRGYVATIAALAAATTALLVHRSRYGGFRVCGCMALVTDSTVDQSIRRNGVLLAATAALAVLSWVSERRRAATGPSPDGAAASGPATPAR